MAKRGPKPKGKVKIKWSQDFAYAIGLLVSDGNLSPDGRHIVFTSKDKELIRLFQRALHIDTSIGKKARRMGDRRTYYLVQFSDVLFYDFLLGIGLMPNKSKVIGKVNIPPRYFFDFLRGAFDGDGCTYSYFDPRWRSSYMFYTTFISASSLYIEWIRKEIFNRLEIAGHITGDGRKTVLQLKYAKAESLKLLPRLYPAKDVLALSRKRLKIEKMLRTIGQRL